MQHNCLKCWQVKFFVYSLEKCEYSIHTPCIVTTISYLAQNLVHLIDDLVTENAELKQQLQSSERERQMLTQQLKTNEAELKEAKENIRREQQQIEKMRQQVQ